MACGGPLKFMACGGTPGLVLGVAPEYIRWLDLENGRTPDGFKWLGTRLSYDELNDMMREMLS